MHEGLERMKNRFLSKVRQLQSASILELLLFYSIPRKDTNPLAHELIKRYGSLSECLTTEDLTKVKGISRNTALLLSLIPTCAACI